MVIKKIIIVTTGQPSTNPRMIKEYLALKEEGYSVKVFYSYWQQWAVEADKKMFSKGEIKKEDFVLTGGSPFEKKWVYNTSRILQKVCKFVYHKTGFFIETSLSRTTSGLTTAAKNEKADLYIAHNIGALPAAVKAANKYKAATGFDAEDFHRGEFKDNNSKQRIQLIKIEDKYIPFCKYVTVASPLIGQAYKKLYQQQDFTTVNNVFSKKFLQQPNPSEKNTLSLFWFSQTIGPHRGLETIVKAINIMDAKSDVKLYLMGNVSEKYKNELRALLFKKESIHFLPPVSPNEVFKVSAQYDIGLSIEEPYVENRDICLTNKIFTYLLAGNCIIFSNTKAQQKFLEENPYAGYLFEAGNEKQLAILLENLYNESDKLKKAKTASLELAKTKWNWEHESMIFKLLIKKSA